MVQGFRRQHLKGEKMLPDIGSKEWEEMAEFMRADLVSNMMLTKLIMEVRKQFEEQGKDFDKEFEKWKGERSC